MQSNVKKISTRLVVDMVKLHLWMAVGYEMAKSREGCLMPEY